MQSQLNNHHSPTYKVFTGPHVKCHVKLNVCSIFHNAKQLYKCVTMSLQKKCLNVFVNTPKVTVAKKKNVKH